MTKMIFSTSAGVDLTYELNQAATTAKWATKLLSERPDALKAKHNHRHGFGSPSEVNAALLELQSIATINGYSFNPHTTQLQQELNVLHRNFVATAAPDSHMHEMNLLIHWIEYEMWGLQLFNLDFNHNGNETASVDLIPPAELSYFTEYHFGNLHLHYVHKGRPFIEMVCANDFIAPPDQCKPQYSFRATCGLVFEETKVRDMEGYYNARGGKSFFNVAFDDPKLRKGFFKLGDLVGDYDTVEKRDALRAQLTGTTIVGWRAE